MSRTRLIYLGVLALAVGVLFWDKSSGTGGVSGPQKSQAASSKPSGRSSLSNSKTPLVSHGPDQGEPVWVSANIDALVESSAAELAFEASVIAPAVKRDVFLPSAAFIAQSRPPVVIEEKAEVEVKVDPGRDLPELSSILQRSGGSCALLSGRVVFPDESIGNYRLVEVRESSVVLEKGEMRVIVSLDKGPEWVK